MRLFTLPTALLAMAIILPVLSAQPTTSERVYAVGDGVSSPVLLHRVPPEYPPGAMAEKIQGLILLQVVVDAKGSVNSVTITHSLGFGLDEAAAEAVGHWEFRPGQKDGKAVAVSMQIEVIYQLPDSLNADGYFKRGSWHATRAESDEAIADLTESLRLNPDFSEAWLVRGTVYAKLHDYPQAVRDFSEAIRRDPLHDRTYYYRAEAQAAMKNFEQAIRDYSEVIRLVPFLHSVYVDRAVAYSALNQNTEALADLEHALKMLPDYPTAFQVRAHIRHQTGDLSGALADERRYRELIGEVRGSTSPTEPPPSLTTPVTPQRIRLSKEVAASNLIRRVDPEYPPLAKQVRVHGIVQYVVTLAVDGSVMNVKLVSGHPLLATAATADTLKQWVYKPTVLAGVPVEVVTQVDVPFSLP